MRERESGSCVPGRSLAAVDHGTQDRTHQRHNLSHSFCFFRRFGYKHCLLASARPAWPSHIYVEVVFSRVFSDCVGRTAQSIF